MSQGIISKVLFVVALSSALSGCGAAAVAPVRDADRSRSAVRAGSSSGGASDRRAEAPRERGRSLDRPDHLARHAGGR